MTVSKWSFTRIITLSDQRSHASFFFSFYEVSPSVRKPKDVKQTLIFWVCATFQQLFQRLKNTTLTLQSLIPLQTDVRSIYNVLKWVALFLKLRFWYFLLLWLYPYLIFVSKPSNTTLRLYSVLWFIMERLVLLNKLIIVLKIFFAKFEFYLGSFTYLSD